MESRQPSNNHGNTGKKGKHSLLSLYGYTLCLLLLGAVVFGLTYSAGGANVLKDEELRKAEEEAAAIEAAKPTPTPRAVSTATAGRLIPFLENSLWGYKNTSGEIVILPAFSAANEFDGNVAFAAKDGLYGLIDRSGAWIAEPAWSSVSDFAEGMAAVEKDGKWGYIDASGNIKIDYSYREAGPFGCGRAAVRTASSFGYIDVMGNIAISEKWSSANVFSNDLAFVSLSSKSYIIDKVGKALITLNAGSSGEGYKEDFALITDSGGCYYINKYGKSAFKKTYSAAKPFSGGYAAVRIDGLWGFINTGGATLIASQYADAHSFPGVTRQCRTAKGYGAI